ncbi:MAG TPA: cupin domain-containing protein [Xanthomonadales bacterium]|nr:cupin domain-containing protein [Xanthomonadales bacterium]
MKTRQFSNEEMSQYVARFNALEPLEAMKVNDIPLSARDLIWSRKLLPVVSPRNGNTPFGTAPIRDQDFSITYAVCPPGTGPSLHAHHKTTETFTCLQGRFEFRWGDKGEDSLVLDRLDTFAVPPGVCRAFRNIGQEEGILQVLITGGVHDMQDIAFPPQTADELNAVQPGLSEFFGEIGLKFDAGV